MPTGLFRTTDQSAHVEYDGVSIPIPRSTYEKKGYKPDFDKLPLEDEYKAAREKLRNAPGPLKGQRRPGRCDQVDLDQVDRSIYVSTAHLYFFEPRPFLSWV
jgi:hypothetical protein